MIVSTAPPWPDGWARRPHSRLYAIFAGIVASCVLFLFTTGLFLAGPRPPSAVVALAISASLLGGAVWCLRVKLQPYSRRASTVDVDGQGVTIRCRSRLGTGMSSAAPVLAVGGTMIAAVGARLGDQSVLLAGSRTALVGAVILLVAILARRRRLGLRLTPHEVSLRTSLRTARLRWDEVDQVSAWHLPDDSWVMAAGPEYGPQIKIQAPRIVQPRMEGGGMSIPVGRLTAAPALAFWVVDHYFRHPEHRHELGTEAALERIRRGPE